MKTTKRSKMLLSSIAMLLVALVALGSASFAWYFTQDTVTAKTTQFSASAADGLVIRHHNGEAWGTKVEDMATKDSLSPAAIDYAAYASVIGGQGTGKSFTDGDLDTNGLTKIAHNDVIATSNNSYFLVDELWVATQSAATNKTATFTVKGSPKTGTYLNLAIYINGTLSKVITSDTVTGNKTYKVVAGSGDAVSLESTASQDVAAITAAGTTVTASMPLGSAAGKGTSDNDIGTHIQIIAFADGTNANCTSEKVSIEKLSVEYSFALNP